MVIALIVILVVVAGAAVGMLYKMGFFTPMSDDELLGVVSQAPAASMTEVSEAPAVTEAPVVPRTLRQMPECLPRLPLRILWLRRRKRQRRRRPPLWSAPSLRSPALTI